MAASELDNQGDRDGVSELATDVGVNSKTGTGGLFGLFKKKDGPNPKKTVTFGDAGAVRSLPLYSLIAVVALIAFWWFATTPFGFDDSFKGNVDQQFQASADDSMLRNEARFADGKNGISIPFTDPMQRDYLAACEQAPRTEADVPDAQDGLRNLLANGLSDMPDYEFSEAETNRRLGFIQTCNPADHSQLVGPATMPSPGDTWTQFNQLRTTGFKNVTLWEHTKTSLWRLMRGMFYGSIIGIPIGFAMGLNSKLRGIFEAPVELFRPVPPLALLPLFIVWFGIGDGTAVNLLIFASVWIMVIAARAGARTVKLSKVRAAYSLGASKSQVLCRVIFPNTLPELFTGVRVALGVSWGTLVAAELVGAETGLGSMIFDARNNLRTDVVVVGIIVIAVIGVLMDVVMRFAESKLIPWRGKG
ncbi:MAG: ABC transporter permease [Acidimicrobiales bacterium]